MVQFADAYGRRHKSSADVPVKGPTNVTGNIDAVGWVLLGAPFVIPVGMFVLWLTGKLFGVLFGGTRRD